MLHTFAAFTVSTALTAQKIRLRPPLEGGVNRIARATCTWSLVPGGGSNQGIVQLSVNEQHLVNFTDSFAFLNENPSAIATWSWTTQFTTAGVSIVQGGYQLELGVEVVADIIVLSKSNISRDARVDVYFERVVISETEKLWLTRQAPRRFPGKPQGP